MSAPKQHPGDSVGPFADEWTTVACPECGAQAEIEARAQLATTGGWIEHLKIRCLFRHWFLLPADLMYASSQR
jgi:hypothetical protein